MSETVSKPIRSPSYPVMSLERAIQAVRKIEGKYRQSPVERTDGAKLIGFTSLSGPANQALAALAAYGLVERAGKGEMRVTPRTRAILHPDNETEKRDALRAAAFEPQLYRDLRDRFTDIAVPPEDGVVSYLNRQSFNASAIRPAAKAFLDTVSYLEEAGANDSHGASGAGARGSQPPEGKPPLTFGGAKVGDLVQWESQGTLQFGTPQRVRFVTDDGEWIAVEGSETGIPMSEVTVEERGVAERPSSPRFALPSTPKEDEAVALGEVEWMRNRLARETNVRLLVKGNMGPREIGNLIQILQAQKAVLESEDQEKVDIMS